MGEILWSDVQEKHKELSGTAHRLRWVVEFAFLEWARLSTGARLDVHAGLLAFVPETAVWVENAEGVASSVAWVDEDVQALQQRLQPLFTAIATGRKAVELSSYPMRLTWFPHSYPRAKRGTAQSRDGVKGLKQFNKAFGLAGPHVVQDSGGVVSVEHEGELNGVELALLYASLLLREYPSSIIQCQSPLAYRRPGICGKIFYGRLDRRWCGPACATRWRRAVLET